MCPRQKHQAIVRELGLARRTARRFLRAGSGGDLLAKPRAGRPSILDPFTDCLHQGWNDGCTCANTLLDEIRALGCRDTYATLSSYLRTLRTAGRAPTSPRMPKVRHITSSCSRNCFSRCGGRHS